MRYVPYFGYVPWTDGQSSHNIITFKGLAFIAKNCSFLCLSTFGHCSFSSAFIHAIHYNTPEVWLPNRFIFVYFPTLDKCDSWMSCKRNLFLTWERSHSRVERVQHEIQDPICHLVDATITLDIGWRASESPGPMFNPHFGITKTNFPLMITFLFVGVCCIDHFTAFTTTISLWDILKLGKQIAFFFC